jgi:polyisoprenoid-binding protein YceI
MLMAARGKPAIRDFAAAALLPGLLAGASVSAHADIWLFDKTATVVRFSYDHLGLSRQSGRFRDIDGRLDFTPTDPESGQIEATIRIADISTGVAELDQLLRSSDFFDTARYPTAVFKSTAVRKTGDKTGEVVGELTMMGVTRPVTLNVTWNFTGEYPLSAINPVYLGKWVSGFSAKTVIERSAWGLKRGIPLLSDEIEISIEAEFLRQE